MKFCQLFVAFLLLGACSQKHAESFSNTNVKIDSTYNSLALDSIIHPYRTKVDAIMKEVIGYADSNFVSTAPNSVLSNFVVDAVFKKGMLAAHAYFPEMNPSNTLGLLNFGGIRASVSKGDITIGTIFELMPFDNQITVLKIDYSKIDQLLTYLFEKGGQPISNATVLLTTATKEMKINAQPLKKNEPLYIITSDYLSTGGDKMEFLLNPLSKWDTGILIRNVLIDEIRENGKIERNGQLNRIEIN
jgi:2',3'-cyclic-nucleotide 2'-phosphodiesterase (5'-nucleotidase family)